MFLYNVNISTLMPLITFNYNLVCAFYKLYPVLFQALYTSFLSCANINFKNLLHQIWKYILKLLKKYIRICFWNTTNWKEWRAFFKQSNEPLLTRNFSVEYRITKYDYLPPLNTKHPLKTCHPLSTTSIFPFTHSKQCWVPEWGAAAD